MEKEAKEEVHFVFYQVFDVIETMRVLKSEGKLSESEEKEYKLLEAKKNLGGIEKTKYQSMKADITKKSLDAVEKQAIKDSIMVEKPEILECKLRTGVQIAVKPIRTICVRNALTNYFAKKLDKLQGGEDGAMFQKFKLYQGGQTTINIKHKEISKATPLEIAIKFGLPIIYSGDEVRFSCSLIEAREGTDTSVALLLMQEAYKNKLMVFATSQRKPASDLSQEGFYWTKEFPLTKEAKSGPEANALLYQNVLGIMEDELGNLLTNDKYQAGSALEIFRQEVNLLQLNSSGIFPLLGIASAQSAISFVIGFSMGHLVVKYINSKNNGVEQDSIIEKVKHILLRNMLIFPILILILTTPVIIYIIFPALIPTVIQPIISLLAAFDLFSFAIGTAIPPIINYFSQKNNFRSTKTFKALISSI